MKMSEFSEKYTDGSVRLAVRYFFEETEEYLVQQLLLENDRSQIRMLSDLFLIGADPSFESLALHPQGAGREFFDPSGRFGLIFKRVALKLRHSYSGKFSKRLMRINGGECFSNFEDKYPASRTKFSLNLLPHEIEGGEGPGNSFIFEGPQNHLRCYRIYFYHFIMIMKRIWTFPLGMLDKDSFTEKAA